MARRLGDNDAIEAADNGGVVDVAALFAAHNFISGPVSMVR